MIRAAWRSVRMRPVPSLLLAALVAAAIIVIAVAFTLAAGATGSGAGGVGESGGSGRADSLAAYGAHGLLLGLGVLTAAALALLVALTFTTSLRRRSDTLALLRVTGASTPLLAGAVLTQALAVGMLGAALGLLGTLGATRLTTGTAAQVLPPGADPLTLPAAVTGLLATLLGAVVPALRVSATPPGPTAQPAASPQSSLRVAGIIGVGLVALGAVGTAVAWRATGLPHRVGVLGVSGAVLLLGLLIGLPVAMRPLTALLGLPALPSSSGRLAVRHLAAAPRGAAAIAAAPTLAAAAVGIGVPLAASLRSHGANGAASEHADTALGLVPALATCVALLAGLCAAGALAAAAAARREENDLMGVVGMSRGQRASQFLCEFALSAAAGVLLGAAAGALLMGATGAVLADQGLGALTVPWRQLLLPLAVGCGAGLLAAPTSLLRFMSPPPGDGMHA